MNELEWRKVKEILNKTSIEDFEKQIGYKFSDDFKNCVKVNNGARPSKNIFDTEKTKERTFKSLLSFNRDDKMSIWQVNDWLKDDINGKLVIFAQDEFGNFICFEKLSGKVVFLDNDTLKTEFVANSFKEFIEKLYEI